LIFHKKLNFYDEELLAPQPTPKLKTIPFILPITTYAIYSQLGAVSSIRNLRIHHAMLTRDNERKDYH
jgi:hypothetical protein